MEENLEKDEIQEGIKWLKRMRRQLMKALADKSGIDGLLKSKIGGDGYPEFVSGGDINIKADNIGRQL